MKATTNQKDFTYHLYCNLPGFLDTLLLLPVMSLYAAELGASVGIRGLIIGLYSITNTPANILFGRLIDEAGYKLPLITGLVGDAVSMFLYSLCHLPIHLAILRSFHGISGGLVAPATMSITADYSGRIEKGRAMSFYGMPIAAATLAGYGGGGFIISRLGRQALFLLGAVLLTIGVVLSLLLPGDKKKGSKTTQASLSEGLKQVQGLLGRRGLTVSYCSIFAQYFTFGGVVTLLPSYLENLGMGDFHMYILLAIFAIMFVILQFPSGVLSDKVGRLIPTIGALSLGILSVVILPSLVPFPLLAVVMALYGIAYGMLFPSISALVADHTAPEERGLATGVFHALLTARVAIRAPIMGWIGGIVGIQSGLALSSIIMVLALASALTALKRI
ncbi:MFS transporter [Chloroflexota bacterium]